MRCRDAWAGVPTSRPAAPIKPPRWARWGRAFLLALVLIVIAAPPAPSQADDPTATGVITGRILAEQTGRPLSPANVVLAGTSLGTISHEDGTFTLEAVPAGEHLLRVTFMGYEAVERRLTVVADEGVSLTLRLTPTVVTSLETIEIRAARPLIDIHKTSTSHDLSTHDLQSMITQSPTLDAIVEQQPGIVRDERGLHFRGGRAEESLFVIDGVKVRDLLSGQSMGREVAAQSATDVKVMTGGFSARYSQAMSGVVETRLKEGSQRWHGSVSYASDLLVGAHNVHQGNLELGGPNVLLAPILERFGDERPDVTFYASLSAELSNGYLPSIRDVKGSPHLSPSLSDEILGHTFSYGQFFAPLAENRWRALFKTAWKADANNKLSLSWTKTLSITQDWGNPDIGDIDRNVSNFPWAWAPRLDHHYTVSNDVNILSLIWNRSLGLNTRTTVRLWRHYSGQHKDVDGKDYSDYDASRDNEIPDDSGIENTPYFVDVGDAQDWRDRFVIVWGLANEWSHVLGAHNVEWGLNAEYHDVQYMALNAHTVYIDPDTSRQGTPDDRSLPLGDEYDLFQVTPNAGNFFIQDHFEHEGMTINAGVTYDYWFPGHQIRRALDLQTGPHMTQALREKFYNETHELFGHRFKGHLSPRLAVSFPINQRAHIFFNYGHYSQRPPYYFVYAKSSSQSGEEYPRIGNPALNPQISVSYEVGGEYQFTDILAAKLSVFWKDMYDYPTTTRLELRERETRRSEFFMYWNMDYARSRGIEVSLHRNRQNYVSGSLSYTFSTSKGKSSDANKSKLIQETGGDSREPVLGEEFLWWHRPHKLTAQLNLRVREDEEPPHWLGLRWPQDLSAKLYFMVRSGRPYTPKSAFGEDVGDAYSRSGPSDITCDLSLAKGFRLATRRFELSFQVFNVFNYQTPLSFDWVTGAKYVPGEGSLIDPWENPNSYRAYLAEEVPRAVETYMENYRRNHDGEDPDQILVDAYAADVAGGILADYQTSYYQLASPSYYSKPRTFRVGIRYEW